jgi:hypothetical protein
MNTPQIACPGSARLVQELNLPSTENVLARLIVALYPSFHNLNAPTMEGDHARRRL